jgi:hypothetical protein
MGFFSDLKEVFFGPQQPPAVFVPPARVQPHAQPVDPAVVANDNAMNDNAPAPSLVKLANERLKHAFMKTKIKNMVTGADVAMPIESVELTADASDNNGQIFVRSGTTESAVLKIHLKEPTGDFDFHSVNLALRQVLNHIPLLKGKIEFAPEKQPTYAEAWDIIAPVLQKHGVDDHTVRILKQHFSVHPDEEMNKWNWDKILVSHDAGKVQVKIVPQPDKSENAKKIASSDQQIVDFINGHKAQILDHIKAKVLALAPLPEGVSAETLTGLDFKVATEGKNKWDQSIKVEFGDGPELKETALAKINTDLLDTFFTEALVHAGGKLPEFFSDVADGPMVADMLREKTNNDPALHNILTAEHFLSMEVKEKRAEAREKMGVVNVKAAQELGGEHTRDIILNLPLPKDVTLATLREDIFRAQHQLALGAEPPAQGSGRAA